jgi:hypothetical protein
LEPALLIGAVVLFLAFLLWNGLVRAPLRKKVRDGLGSAPGAADAELAGLFEELRRGANTGPILQKIKRRVAHERNPKLKAAYLCVVGDVLRRTLSRRGTALRYFVKALDTDPACVEARQGMRELLLAQRRGFRLEQLYWRVLSRLDPTEHGCDAVVATWVELATLLERRRSGRDRARAIRRLVAVLDDSQRCADSAPAPFDCDDD